MNLKFNDAQVRAINHFNGPALILAGPGSGKTAVITHRTYNLIEKYGVNPANILVITFTKAAATEMKERFNALTGGKGYPVVFGTFHAVFFTILKHAYNYKSSDIVTREEQYECIKNIIERMDMEYEDENEFVGNILSEISRVKGELINIANYYSINCGEKEFRYIFNEYDKMLERKRKIDFDDMLVYCHELLSNRRDILSAWQNKYRYILIDEFQDINKVQYDIIRMLALPENNLFIVGDDDQSIYGFRGAKPEIMLGFQKDYKEAETILLNVNYRCNEHIVQQSKKLIAHNRNRFQKDIKAANKTGLGVKLLDFKDIMEEHEKVLELIREYNRKGFAYEDMAVLTRTNIGSRLMIEKFMENNIPFRAKDAIPNIYEHWIAKDILAYIHIALGSTDRKDFLRIINKPLRYISRDALDTPDITFTQLMNVYEDKNWMTERIEKMETDMRVVSRISPYAAINYIRHAIGYEEYLAEYANNRHMIFDELLEVLDEIMEAAREYKTYDEWFVHMEDYTKELLKQARNRELEVNAVNLMTMHSSKGLEYKIVFVLDVNEENIPYKKAVLDEEIEEERRMMYVAMTRAKEDLFLCCPRQKYNKSLEMSRFIRELISTENISEGKKTEREK